MYISILALSIATHLEVVHADDVYDGADHPGPVLHHPRQQRLQPALDNTLTSYYL